MPTPRATPPSVSSLSMIVPQVIVNPRALDDRVNGALGVNGGH